MIRAEPPRLVCLGNLTVDDVVLPDGQVQADCIGGDALFAAVAARLWEPCVEMVAPVGTDFPPDVSNLIAAAGFSFDGLPQRSIATIRNEVRYEEDGGRTWTAYTPEEDFYTLSPLPEDIPAFYHDAHAFLISAMSLDAQEALIGWMKRQTKASVALDLQEDYIAGNEARIDAMIRQVDIFMPSEEEVRRLLGHEDWVQAARYWAARGPRVVVIKRGGAGSLVYDAGTEQTFEVPAFPATVVDTTGAGDSYCGGFLAALTREPGNLVGAAQSGAVSASFTVEGFGVDPLLRASPDDATTRLADWQSALGGPFRA